MFGQAAAGSSRDMDSNFSEIGGCSVREYGMDEDGGAQCDANEVYGQQESHKHAAVVGRGGCNVTAGEQIIHAPVPRRPQSVKALTGLGAGIADIAEQTAPPAVWSVRSGCSENDIYYNPTPSQAAYSRFRAGLPVDHKEQQIMNQEAQKKKKASPPVDNNAENIQQPSPPVKTAEKNLYLPPVADAHVQHHKAALQVQPVHMPKAHQKPVAAGGKKRNDEIELSPTFLKWYEGSALKKKTNELVEAQFQLSIAQNEIEKKMRIINDQNKVIATISATNASLGQHVHHQSAYIWVLENHPPPNYQPPPPVYNREMAVHPADLIRNRHMALHAADQSPLAHRAQQHRRPAHLPEDFDDATTLVHTPSTDHAHVGPSADPFRTTPDPSDDVFGNHVPVTPTPAPARGGWTPPAEFAKKPLSELLSSCFKKVETALRGLTILNVAPNKARGERGTTRQSPGEKNIFHLAQEHLDSNKMAYVQFGHPQERYWLVLGMISHEIVARIFDDSVLGQFPGPHATAFTEMWAHEQHLRNPKTPRVVDLEYRNSLNMARVNLANEIVKTPGFWKWVHGFAADKTNKIVGVYASAFLDAHLSQLADGLNKAITEAVKIAVRMRQEPKIFEFFFPRHGTPWGGDFHVHRNPELVGKKITDGSPPYVVRCTALPLIKYKDFSNGAADPVVLHKAEVTVGDRKENLRPNQHGRR